jgi:peptidoglycan/LPS O-acetylase OafA/YrhL
MTSAPASAERRIGALDSLRGIAILMVLASHLLPPALHLPAGPPALEAVGRGGVILFFLLSGYLIYGNVRRQPTTVFLRRRLFKILPSYWLSLACIAALDWSGAGAAHYSWRAYVTNFLMIPDVTADPQLSGVYWTLLIEVKFYLFIALQYAILKDRFLAGIMGAIVASGIALFAVRGHGSQLLACFPAFYVGIYLSRAEERGWTAQSCAALAAATLATAGEMIVTLPDERIWSAAYLAGGVILFVLFLKYRLGDRRLGFLGMTSYNNYLYHSLVAGLVFAAFGGGPAAAAAVLIASTGLAVVLYWAFEQPLVRLGRRWEAMTPNAPAILQEPVSP